MQSGIIVGIAALKVPARSYRNRIGQKTGYDISESLYPFELGYVVVEASARKQGLSHQLVEAAIRQAIPEGLFATTSCPAMRSVLPRFAFKKVGNDYEGADKICFHYMLETRQRLLHNRKARLLGPSIHLHT